MRVLAQTLNEAGFCQMKQTLLFICLLCLSSFSQAGGIDPQAFSSPAEEEAFRDVIAELRCPKCQNQSVADSDAPIAQDMRERVFEQMKAGKDKDQIVAYMIDRYGDFVTYRPPFRGSTVVLWLGPPMLVLFLLVFLFWRASRLSRAVVAAVDDSAVDRLLATYGDDQQSKTDDNHARN